MLALWAMADGGAIASVINDETPHILAEALTLYKRVHSAAQGEAQRRKRAKSESEARARRALPTR